MGMMDPLAEGGWDWVKALGWVFVVVDRDNDVTVD